VTASLKKAKPKEGWSDMKADGKSKLKTSCDTKMAYGGGVKKMSAGSGLKMVEKDGQKVPFYAADGVGKMARGGKAEGKMMKSKGRNVAKATMQRIADKKVKGHESRMHKGAKKK
jgi:hypothetical protein